MHQACFVLSTGRCGTQWLASSLAESFADRLAVAHEPLHLGYRPREALRCADASIDWTPPAVVEQHLQAIEAVLEQRPYLECGHPCWSTLPWIARRLQGRVRIVHLLRHPVPTACSWLTHRAYQPPLLPHIPEKVLLSAFDQGVKFEEYRARWPRLSAFEKCLYYWAEVNAFALDLQSRVELPWSRLRYEDLFHGEGLACLLSFLELPPSEPLSRRRSQVVDEHHALLAEAADLQLLQEHPQVLELARRLGYAMEAVDEAVLARRYLAPRLGPG
jgi:hypothetical protein